MGDDRHQGEMNMKTLEFLNKEKTSLEQKISETLKRGDIGTYKNLIIAYKEVLRLIKDEDTWQEKFSHYYSNGKELMSTWEQKGEDIRNEKIYEVKEVIKNKLIYLNTIGGRSVASSNRELTFQTINEDKCINAELNIYINKNYAHTIRVKVNDSIVKEGDKDFISAINDNGKITLNITEYIHRGINNINIIPLLEKSTFDVAYEVKFKNELEIN